LHQLYSGSLHTQTVAVIRFLTQEGQVVDVAAASGRGLQSAQRAAVGGGGEIAADALPEAHAELEAFVHGIMAERGWTPVGLATTWNICPNCVTWLGEEGFQVIGSRAAVWVPPP
jgi:hypothetical protein